MPELYHTTLGFDRFIRDVERWIDQPTTKSTFPPHNIIQIEDNRYVVELAVAGFSKDEIDISLQENKLTITGKKVDAPKLNYLHHGIGTRSFIKTIYVADTVEVRGAEFKDGILRVGLENVIPDTKKPRKIEIGDSLEFLPTQQLLVE